MTDPDEASARNRIRVPVVEDEFFIVDELSRTLTDAGSRVEGPLATV